MEVPEDAGGRRVSAKMPCSLSLLLSIHQVFKCQLNKLSLGGLGSCGHCAKHAVYGGMTSGSQTISILTQLWVVEVPDLPHLQCELTVLTAAASCADRQSICICTETKT